MKTKIFYGNQYIGSMNVDGRKYTKWQVFKFRAIRRAKRVTLVLGAFCLLGWAYYFGSMFAPVKVMAVDKEVYVTASSTMPAMLMKICRAESGGKQFKADGHVLRGKITPSDIGFCQINETYWNDKARDMGIDIYTEQGNKDMAIYIFNNYGEQPWSASKDTWSK